VFVKPQARLTLDDAHRVMRRDIGPINLEFTVPMLCASRLQVRYLQVCSSGRCCPAHNRREFRFQRSACRVLRPCWSQYAGYVLCRCCQNLRWQPEIYFNLVLCVCRS